ncbi:unnamed protein product [Polarella glacialis]|uniref:Uncharacterized protein n=1 Tax=Polarella glacialis TaxID=89957 RepID=A0A813FK70_POLGL|nr:unnamed protein product [Polarella glacialis]
MTVQKLACIALLACLALARLPACLALLIGFQSGRWSSSGTFFFVFDFFVCCAVCVFFGFALLRLLVGGVASKMRSTQTALYIGNGYQERMSPRDHDKTFSASDAIGATAEVAYKKHPFGILRYSPGKENIGAMVMEIIPKSRYPGGSEGQAFAAGMKSGWLLKSVIGKDVSGMEFAQIMDLLGDEVMDQRMSQHFHASEKAGRLAEPVDLPITVVYQEGAGQDIKWPQMKEDIEKGFTR